MILYNLTTGEIVAATGTERNYVGWEHANPGCRCIPGTATANLQYMDVSDPKNPILTPRLVSELSDSYEYNLGGPPLSLSVPVPTLYSHYTPGGDFITAGTEESGTLSLAFPKPGAYKVVINTVINFKKTIIVNVS